MADYFVDFSAGTNGTGTSASPWNVFTTTENAGVVGGDTVWFRRGAVAVNQKLISWKAGDAVNRINYLGWPKVGDVHYDSRPAELRAAWDGDAYDYMHQHNNSSTIPTSIMANYINVHRVEFYQAYTTYSTQTAVRFEDITNVDIYNCYIHTYSTGANSAYFSGTIYASNTSNINLHDTMIVGNSIGTNYNREHTFTIHDSTVNFNNCDITLGGSQVTTIWTKSYMSNENHTSYMNNSTIEMNDCTIHDYYNMSACVQTELPQSQVIMFRDCDTTISGCNILHEAIGTTYNSDISKYSWLPLFRSRGANSSFNVIDTTFTHNMNRSCDLAVGEEVMLNMDNTSVQVQVGKQSICHLLMVDTDHVEINNTSGDMSNTSGVWNEQNFFVAFSAWGYALSTNITINNVDPTWPALDMSQEAEILPKTFTADNTKLFWGRDLYLTRVGDLNISEVILGQLHFFQKDYHSTENIRGGFELANKIEVYNTTFTNIPINLHSTVTSHYKALFYGCTGGGTSMFSSSSIDYAIEFNAIRNYGFSGVGTMLDNPNIVVNQVVNSFNNGGSIYSDYTMTVASSSVRRVDGAGYSNSVIKKAGSTDKARFPQLGKDSIWVYFPTAGTYNVTYYFCYETTTDTLSTGDVEMGLEIVDSYSYPVTSQTLSEDLVSVWEGTPVSGMKLEMTIDIPKTQYAPVFFNIYSSYPGQIIYVDPKINIEIV